jgi:putative DNA primase/helicase
VPQAARQPMRVQVGGREVERFYDYTDEQGQRLFQVVRYHPKGFSQRRPDGKGGWANNLGNVRRVLYRLPELLESPSSEPVFVVEGEKDAESLRALGLVATTNPGGAGKWSSLLAKDPTFQQPLDGRIVAVMGDNDDAGRRHALMVADLLLASAGEVRLVAVPDGFKDVTEYIESRDGADSADLRALVMGWHKAAPLHKPSPGSRLVTSALAGIEAKPIDWLWPNRIPAGMFSMIIGNPATGKSFIMAYLASVVSTGRQWADGAANTLGPSGVLLVAAEDSLEHVVKPRLLANGHDGNLIRAYRYTEKDGRQEYFDVKRHLKELCDHMEEYPHLRLVVIDPITSFLGNTNENSNSEVRAALLGLMNLADERNVTIIGISHLNKKSDLQAMHRSLGSVAFMALARSVWLVDADQEKTGGVKWRKFLPVKTNLSIEATGLRFKLVDARVEFDAAPYCESADDAVSPQPRMEARALDDAKEFLAEQLKDGPKFAREIFDAAEGEGLAVTTVRRAGKALGLAIRKTKGGWLWSPAKQDDQGA